MEATKVRQLFIARKISYFSLLSPYRACAVAASCNKKWALFHRISPIVRKKNLSLAFATLNKGGLIPFSHVNSKRVWILDWKSLFMKSSYSIINFKPVCNYLTKTTERVTLKEMRRVDDKFSILHVLLSSRQSSKYHVWLFFSALKIESQDFIFQFPTQ